MPVIVKHCKAVMTKENSMAVEKPNIMPSIELCPYINAS